MKEIILFKNLEYNSLKDVFLACELKEYCPHEIIYQEGDESKYFYLIKEGEFKVKFFTKIFKN